jgi:cytochrome P450
MFRQPQAHLRLWARWRETPLVKTNNRITDLKLDISTLDSANFVDLELGSQPVRQGMISQFAAEWARRPPFYIVNHGVTQLVVGRYRDLLEVYQDNDRFTSTPPRLPGYERFDIFNGIPTIAQSDGAEHDRVRKAFAASFGPSAINHLEAAIRQFVDSMLNEVEAMGGPFDFMHDFAGKLVFRFVLDELLRLTPTQQEAIFRFSMSLSLIVNHQPGEPFPAEFLEALEGALRIIGDIMEDRRGAFREHDFISNVLQYQDASDSITREEILNNIFGILGGALGTTSASTSAMMINLLKHRDQFEQVIADPSLIPQTVEESLRYQGPGFLSFARFALADTEVGGTPVLKGMPLNLNQQAGNYDPTVFADPLKFDIHRNPKNVITFGAGRHICLGQRLARKMMSVTLERICLRYPGIRLQDPNFEPVYEGMFGEIRQVSAPMHLGFIE